VEGSYWLVVSSPGNFETTRSLGFGVQGFKARHERRTAGMRPGDRLLWYLTGLGVFAATATVTSSRFEEHTPIWKSEGRREDDYPWRVRIRPDLVLEPARGLEAAAFREDLRYLRKWPAPHWRLGFQGMLHRWPREDFELVENALRGKTG